MSDNLTENLPPRSFEDRVLSQLAAFGQQLNAFAQELAATRQDFNNQLAVVRQDITSVRRELAEQREMIVHLHDRVVSVETRLTALDEKVEARLHDTRPIWEGVQTRLTGIEAEQKSLGRQFRSLAADIFGLRVRVDNLEGESV